MYHVLQERLFLIHDGQAIETYFLLYSVGGVTLQKYGLDGYTRVTSKFFAAQTLRSFKIRVAMSVNYGDIREIQSFVQPKSTVAIR